MDFEGTAERGVGAGGGKGPPASEGICEPHWPPWPPLRLSPGNFHALLGKAQGSSPALSVLIRANPPSKMLFPFSISCSYSLY